MADKENLQRQAAGHVLEIDKLKQVWQYNIFLIQPSEHVCLINVFCNISHTRILNIVLKYVFIINYIICVCLKE